MSEAPSDNMEKFVVRMPEGMRDRIRRAAERNNRSMNSEIVATLNSAYPEPTTKLDEIAALVAADGKPRTFEHEGKTVTIFLETVVEPPSGGEDD